MDEEHRQDSARYAGPPTVLRQQVTPWKQRVGALRMTKDVIELRGATKRFRSASGGVHTAVHDLTMTVAPNEFVAVVGPTGCGKSTTLSLVSGLEPASEGEVLVAGEPVRGIPDGVGYMFQN